MKLSPIYKIIKQMLDQRVGIDLIVKCTGLSEIEILNFYNGNYKYIKKEEELQELYEAIQASDEISVGIVKVAPYDNDYRKIIKPKQNQQKTLTKKII